MTSGAIRASCACGQVTLALGLPLLFASHCHCATCRRTHAAAFVTWTAVPPERLRTTGRLATFVSSPGVQRRFCPDCGTHVLFTADSVDRAYVPVAALRDPCPLPIESHVSIEERAPWLLGVEDLPCFLAKSETRASW